MGNTAGNGLIGCGMVIILMPIVIFLVLLLIGLVVGILGAIF